MEAEQFDTWTTRLTGQVTRRRGLRLLGLLGVAGLGLGPDAAAGKKRKRKGKGKKKHKKGPQGPQQPTCTGCTACEACVDGACLPLADGVPCGNGGVCINEVCGQPCTTFGAACPGTEVCPLGDDMVCATDYSCSAPCTTNDDCATGEVCGGAPCGALPAFVCFQIAAI